MGEVLLAKDSVRGRFYIKPATQSHPVSAGDDPRPDPAGSNLAELAGTDDWQEGQRFSSGVADDEVASWAQGLAL